MAEQLRDAAGMTDTSLEDSTRKSTNRATPYIVMAGRVIEYEGPDPSYKWPGAGALSTPTDLVRMGGLFLTDKIIGADLRSELFTPPTACRWLAESGRLCAGPAATAR